MQAEVPMQISIKPKYLLRRGGGHMQVNISMQINISSELKREIEAFAYRRINPNANSHAACTAEDLMEAQKKISVLMMALISELEAQGQSLNR